MKISFVDGVDVGRFRVVRINFFTSSAGFFQASWYSDMSGKREHNEIVVVRQKNVIDTAFIFVHEVIHSLIWKFLSKKRHSWLHDVHDRVSYFFWRTTEGGKVNELKVCKNK